MSGTMWFIYVKWLTMALLRTDKNVDIMITEREFSEACEESLRSFSRRIRASGLSIYKIGKLAHLSWRTVQKAVDCVPIRFENAERIKLVIKMEVQK